MSGYYLLAINLLSHSEDVPESFNGYDESALWSRISEADICDSTGKFHPTSTSTYVFPQFCYG